MISLPALAAVVPFFLHWNDKVPKVAGNSSYRSYFIRVFLSVFFKNLLKKNFLRPCSYFL